MYKTNLNTKIAILNDSKKKQWPLGDYIHILSFLPNIKFRTLDWYSSSDTFKIIKEVDFINDYKKLNKFDEKKYDHIINLCDNFENSKKTFYINNLFDPKKMIKKILKVY